MADERFDGLLMNLAQNAGSIENILDSFFGFLHRKTDFFTGHSEKSKPEKLIKSAFDKYWEEGQKKAAADRERHRQADEERKARKLAQQKKDEEEYRKMQQQEVPAVEEVDEDTPVGIIQETEVAKAVPETSEGAEVQSEEKTDDGPAPEGNGGKTRWYTWVQTLSTLEVFVPIPPGTRAKQVICDLGVNSLKVGLKGEPLIFEGKLHDKVKPDDCMWTLLDGKTIQIAIEKFDEMKWWPCVIQGHPEIDTKKIVPENSKLSDLDGETRQTVEKMMFDQRAKSAGLPTSDQQKQHEMLEKFKKAHPEMDFSNCKVNYGGDSFNGMNFPTPGQQ